MKNLILTFIALTTLSAQASYFQTTCANSTGNIKMNQGHSDNKLSVTKTTCAGRSHRCEDTVIVLDRREYDIEISDELVLDSEETRNCQPGRRGGMGSYKSTFTQKIVITKKDGSEYIIESTPQNPSYLNDLSYDKLRIEGHLICERFVSNRIMCEQ